MTSSLSNVDALSLRVAYRPCSTERNPVFIGVVPDGADVIYVKRWIDKGGSINNITLVMFPFNGEWEFTPETTVNGVPVSEYDYQNNDTLIAIDPDVLKWASKVDALNRVVLRNYVVFPLVGGAETVTDENGPFATDEHSWRVDRYVAPDGETSGEYQEIYSTESRVTDETAGVFEKTLDWDGTSYPSLVDANATPGWNHYRVRLESVVKVAGVAFPFFGSPTRYVSVWVGDAAPTYAYYYTGAAVGSFKKPTDWTLTRDGIVPNVETPVLENAIFSVG